jgi:uncharacterized protein (DUF302 family)/uncharacterized membrane protein YidH (DUF202 family)
MTVVEQASPRDYLAVERTFLAWIRTGLALMGLGFVLARFGIFLQEFTLIRPTMAMKSYGLSQVFGTCLILLGVTVSVLSLFRYLRLINDLKEGKDTLSRPSRMAVSAAILLAMLGIAMAIYLLWTKPVPGKQDVQVQDQGQVQFQVQEAPVATTADNGIVQIPSKHTVQETVAKLEAILTAKNVKLFTIVDHSSEAEKAGMKMPNTKLLIFGNPKAGTPLMLKSPTVALDLPLKILVAEDAAGKVWISYNATDYLQKRHNLPAELLPNIAVIEAVAAKIAE